jgi:putative oxidoreductase
MNLGRVILRTTVGGLFVGHGTQKLFGWFDGPGIGGVEQMFGHIGLHPPKAHAIAAGVAETGGGAALVLGAATPLACSVLIATMITAIQTVHGKNGPWAVSQGWEYNAVLIGQSLHRRRGALRRALGAAGPRARGRRRRGRRRHLLRARALRGAQLARAEPRRVGLTSRGFAQRPTVRTRSRARCCTAESVSRVPDSPARNSRSPTSIGSSESCSSAIA